MRRRIATLLSSTKLILRSASVCSSLAAFFLCYGDRREERGDTQSHGALTDRPAGSAPTSFFFGEITTYKLVPKR